MNYYKGIVRTIANKYITFAGLFILKMNITILVAASENNAIGYNNRLLWRLPNDLRFFKQTTWGSVIVMGRKTFESLGSKPLPGRVNMVITKQKKTTTASQLIFVTSPLEALEQTKLLNYKELFVTGGAQVYETFLPMTTQILLTRVHTKIDGDTFLPQIYFSKWQLVSDKKNTADDKHAYPYSFQVWKRK